MTKIDELIAERDRLLKEKNEAERRLEVAEQALLDERVALSGIELYKVGDIILVSRKLFGKKQMWPAKINHVYRSFTEGDYKEDDRYEWSGQHWEHLHISYGFYWQQKDGGYGGTGDSARHDQVQPMVVEVDG